MRDPRRLDRSDRLEHEVRSHSLEEARASAQEDRRDVQLQLVDQAGRQVLVDDVVAATEEDVQVAIATGGVVAVNDVVSADSAMAATTIGVDRLKPLNVIHRPIDSSQKKIGATAIAA